MLDNQGLIKKFRVNRPLVEDELSHQLKQVKRLEVEPVHQRAIIKLNDTFLESVDKYFTGKGELTFIIGSTILLLMGGWGATTFSLLFLWGDVYTSREATFVFGMVTLLTLPMAAIGILLVLKDSFRHTHYPIRLNRKNRRVYVFRLDGTILDAAWDDLFFCLGRSGPPFMGIQSWDIRAHVIGADGWEVNETFAFSAHSSSHENLQRHWEFMRRYMEEGPEAVLAPHGVECHGVDEQRQTFGQGLHSLLFNLHGAVILQLIMLPIWYFPSAIGRWFAMRTSKIPQWPQWVEDACAIESDDPFVHDGRSHPLNPTFEIERVESDSARQIRQGKDGDR